MRESPSGAANAGGSTLLSNVVLAGAGGSQTCQFNLPSAKPGDTVAYSFDSPGIGPVVGQSIIPANGVVLVNLYNFTANPFTIVSVTLFVEVLPRG
jgi:hypothetical protein